MLFSIFKVISGKNNIPFKKMGIFFNECPNLFCMLLFSDNKRILTELCEEFFLKAPLLDTHGVHKITYPYTHKTSGEIWFLPSSRSLCFLVGMSQDYLVPWSFEAGLWKCHDAYPYLVVGHCLTNIPCLLK